MNNRTLWSQFRDGNSHVFEVIYERYINLLANYGRRICTDDELVKDAIQDLSLSGVKVKNSVAAYGKGVFKSTDDGQSWNYRESGSI